MHRVELIYIIYDIGGGLELANGIRINVALQMDTDQPFAVRPFVVVVVVHQPTNGANEPSNSTARLTVVYTRIKATDHRPPQ